MSHHTWLLIITAFYTFVYGVPTSSLPMVRTNNGNVLGAKDTSTKGREFYSFKGIPFAQPPIGDLRFKPPFPVSNWQGTLDATNFANSCLQVNFTANGTVFPITIIGSEDCLYLNVYTPQLPDGHSTPLPVLFYIFGGGFTGGNTARYGAHRLMDQEVVLVTTEYRLGALGYLCTGDSSLPGNYGSLDQVEALKWVQKNIRHFGGDPDRVVIFGGSSGAIDVSFLQLYPEAKGLFHGIMTLSGISNGVLSLKKNPLGIVKTLANILSCPSSSSAVMVNCLKNKNASELVQASLLLDEYGMFGSSFTPCVEDSQTGLFLRGKPVDLFLKGEFLKVPTITGTNRDEGATINSTYLIKFDDNFLHDQLKFWIHNLTEYNNIDVITDVVREEYFKGINNQSALKQAFIDMITDAWLRSSTQLNAQLLTFNDVRTYVYSFEYEYSNEPYVIHGQELNYLFNLSESPLLTSQDQQMSEYLTGMWANFASSLNPSETWKPTPFTRDLSYLKITNNGSSMQKGLRTAQSEFWDFTIPIIAGVDDVPLTICKALHFC